LFVGREYEIRQLEKYRNSKEAEFIIVYGRRRVGKTFLIKEFFDDTYDFHVTGLYKKPKKMQLKNFYLALQETERYLVSRGIQWSRYDIVECYMIMGGIPYYLKLLDNEQSYLANIDNIFFKRNGPLWDEFNHLYETLFGNSKAYLKVIEALSTRKFGLTRKEIINETKLDDNGLLTEMLKNLKDSQFVRAYNTFGYDEKNVVYQLADYFTLFYLRFMKGKQNPDEHFWTHYIDNPSKSSWAGQTFEQVCKEHINQVKKAIGIGALLTDISSWQGISESGKAQIDLVIDRRDRTTNICEIKFSVDEFAIDKDYEDKLKKNMRVFREATKSRKALQLVMITTYGVRQNAHSGIMQSQVRMDDLFVAQ
jgi:AAA+ ATPase superfamily predicted ATPase